MAAARIKIPALPLTGGCQCARVRYRIHDVPYVFYLCHCRECQRHTSSAFGESLRVETGTLEITGQLKTFQRKADSGATRTGRFCPECGVRIVHGASGSKMVNIKAGTLDDTSWLAPAGHIWVRSRQQFFDIPEQDLTYEGQPPDNYAALSERWRAMLGS